MGCFTGGREEESARGLIRENSPWDRMFSVAAGPSYRTMMVEFLSTFVFRPRPADRPNSDMDDPNVEPLPPEARVLSIPDPFVCYIHCCIATSISARGKNNEWATKVDLFFLYFLYTGTPCSLLRCLVEYFASYGKRQRRSRLIGVAFITRIAHHFGRYFPFLDDMLSPAPFEPLDLRTMRRMKIVVNFPDLGHRFVANNHQIFVPDPIVHLVQLEAGEVEMPRVADVLVMDGDMEPQVDQGHPQEPPQIPRRVYHAVRLPQST
ncbi:hypothetical protein HanPSC8_Chr09g0361251 [Helianthus annuus]|nr:hypothetical protein HanPSC8_Chr09g0361251 [Helianthus annuus]